MKKKFNVTKPTKKQAAYSIVIAIVLFAGITAASIIKCAMESGPETVIAVEDQPEELSSLDFMTEPVEKPEDPKTAENDKRDSDSSAYSNEQTKASSSVKQSAASVNRPTQSSEKTSSESSNATAPKEEREDSVKPTSHTHDWQEVYSTRPVYKTKLITQCNNCKEDITGRVDDHNEKNYMNGCGSWSNNVPVKEQVGSEKYVSGYRCACGATK